eukprot:TRINITY_DN48923_c0_g1_i1.p1 TRINITY_DN48923_c0_g1~~TRINITY_DN48923_c0_g1_i1.p1  ORF type:complete len:295 (-),score=33.07 TRINITY_DN48923_c0_g1_i1:23-877(-)
MATLALAAPASLCFSALLLALGELSSVQAIIQSSVCTASGGLARDSNGYRCQVYDLVQSLCEGFDDSDFSSASMCCACGGGNVEVEPPPPKHPCTTVADCEAGFTCPDGYCKPAWTLVSIVPIYVHPGIHDPNVINPDLRNFTLIKNAECYYASTSKVWTHEVGEGTVDVGYHGPWNVVYLAIMEQGYDLAIGNPSGTPECNFRLIKSPQASAFPYCDRVKTLDDCAHQVSYYIADGKQVYLIAAPFNYNDHLEVTVFKTCSADSDCSDGLVCRSGRCQVETVV